MLKTVKQRLDTYDPDGTKTIWMKTSEIGHYWMARRLSNIQLVPNERPAEQIIHIETQFPTTNFTLSTDTVAKRIQVNGLDLKQVQSRRNFRGGAYLTEAGKTYLSFELNQGRTTIFLLR